jgi:hypothetical protein
MVELPLSTGLVVFPLSKEAPVFCAGDAVAVATTMRTLSPSSSTRFAVMWVDLQSPDPFTVDAMITLWWNKCHISRAACLTAASRGHVAVRGLNAGVVFETCSSNQHNRSHLALSQALQFLKTAVRELEAHPS